MRSAVIFSDVPAAVELAERLRRRGLKLPRNILTAGELAAILKGK